MLGQVVQFQKAETHYISDVLRLKEGDDIFLFNNGVEFRTMICSLGKNKSELKVENISDNSIRSVPVCLAVAVIKPARFEWLIEKATELGVQKIQPIITEFVNQPRMKMDRFKKIIIEASEQCARNDVPELAEPVKLAEFLKKWKAPIYFADERLPDCSVKKPDDEFAVLIGPEGGFSESEFAAMEQAGAKPVNLGKTILRAETAAIVAVAKLV